MYIAKDVWFVGHCLVSPVRTGWGAMAQLGSVVTRDMLPNRTYAGIPAVDVTDKMGPQFEGWTSEQKKQKMGGILQAWFIDHPEHEDHLEVINYAHFNEPGHYPHRTVFNVATRTYRQTYSEAEVAFLKAHVPLIKFTPEGAPPFVVPQRAVEPIVELGI